MLSYWKACAVAIMLVGSTTAGIFFRGSVFGSRASILVEPTAIDFGTVPEGERLQGEFTLKNISRDVIQIERFAVSCGCVSIKVDGTDWQGQSLEVSADSKRSIALTWETKNVIGASRQTVSVVGRSQNGPIDKTRVVSCYVISGPRTFPPSVHVESDHEKQCNITIASGRAQPNYTVSGLKSSNDLRIVDCIIKPNSSTLSGDLYGNYQLSFTFRPTGDKSVRNQSDRETIDLTLDMVGNTVTIPILIYYQKPVPNIRLFPSVLILPHGESGNRTVRIVCDNGICALADKPPIIKRALLITTPGRSSEQLLDIDFDTRDFAPTTDDLGITLTIQGNNEIYSLPIQVKSADK